MTAVKKTTGEPTRVSVSVPLKKSIKIGSDIHVFGVELGIETDALIEDIPALLDELSTKASAWMAQREAAMPVLEEAPVQVPGPPIVSPGPPVAAQALTHQYAASTAAPAPPDNEIQIIEGGLLVAHEKSLDGEQSFLKVIGGPWTKYGVPLYPEQLYQLVNEGAVLRGYASWPVNTRYPMPDGFSRALVQMVGGKPKRVVGLE